jgi:hypothetical protein
VELWELRLDRVRSRQVLQAAAGVSHQASSGQARRGRAIRPILRHQPGAMVGGRRCTLRESAQRLLAPAPRRGFHPAAAGAGAACSAVARPGADERSVSDYTRVQRPAACRLRGRGGTTGTDRGGPAAGVDRLRRKEAYRGTFRERPALGVQERRLGEAQLFVLPSTSPANAAVSFAERLRWFRELASRASGW